MSNVWLWIWGALFNSTCTWKILVLVAEIWPNNFRLSHLHLPCQWTMNLAYIHKIYKVWTRNKSVRKLNFGTFIREHWIWRMIQLNKCGQRQRSRISEKAFTLNYEWKERKNSLYEIFIKEHECTWNWWRLIESTKSLFKSLMIMTKDRRKYNNIIVIMLRALRL